ncbi:carbohydrate-binding protein [Streptomyces sp. KR80]|uniref:carbohydrate-binding protein n=1 Tax=Streptomyces sp. KR80 TaxID=3457426 RepID=UPI003FD1FB9F
MRRWTAMAAPLAMALVLFVPGTAKASVVWDGDASKGTGVFALIGSNCASPGSVTVVSDDSRGKIFRFRKPAGLERCESRGIANNGQKYHFVNGRTYYLGWSFRLSNPVNNHAVFQWKSYGNHIQNWPVVLKMVDGKLTMLQRQPNNVVHTPWSKTITATNWNHIVLGLHLSDQTTGGWVELWLNGAKQTFTNGSQRWAARTWDDINDPKWGVYGADASSVDNHLDDLKVGTTYADVATSSEPTPTEPPQDTYPAWAPGTPYTVDAQVSYDGRNYRCLQAHTSQTGWEPPNTPALWQEVT